MSESDGRATLSSTLIQLGGVPLKGGHRLGLLENGAIAPALEAAIRGARSTVHLTVFMWWPGEFADRICGVLCAAAKRGVTVRVVLDAVGSKESGDELDRMREAGCDVRHYRSPLKVSPFLARERSHRKVVVVDGTLGFTGGFGIRDVWLGDGESPEHWRDTHLRVEGPAVRAMQAAFSEVWTGAGGDLLGPDCFPDQDAPGDACAAFIQSRTVVGQSNARILLEALIAGAKRRVWVSTGYFVPPRKFREVMTEASGRGVDLRVLVPGPHTDMRAARLAQRSLYPYLEKHGVRVFEYQPSMIHRKVALIDEETVCVGSINLDTLSLRHLQEGTLVCADGALSAQIEAGFLRDFARSEEVHKAHRNLDVLARLGHRILHPTFRA